MKRRITYAIGLVVGICGVGVLLILLCFGRDIFEFAIVAHDAKQTMDAAKKYMDSLTDKDIHAWIQRTQIYLNHPTNLINDANAVPPDLKRLGITGIEARPNAIIYVWLGGIDETALSVQQMSNRDFQLTAFYTPYSNRMIWPR